MNLNDEQGIAATTTGQHLCIDAGAGSGKTRVLIARIVHLLEHEHADLSEIVAITFTRKAASEMITRLREAFHAKADREDPASMNFWRDLERRVETARISTIDSFCKGLLKSNALALGIDPDFSLLSDAESQLFREENILRAFLDLLERGDEHATRVATEYGIGASVTTLISLVRQEGLVDRALGSSPVDAPESLQARWAEIIRERRRTDIAGYCEALKGFEGLCSSEDDKREVARREMIAICIEILSDNSSMKAEQLLERMKQFNMRGGSKKNWESEDAYDRLKQLQKEVIEYAKRMHLDESVESIGAEITVALSATYQNVIEEYREAKRKQACMEFADLLRLSSEMLTEHTDLRGRAAAGIKHLLIDEFQDTNVAQLELAKRLMRTAKSQGAELFVVGDAKQSIYKFRGAEVEVFEEARRLAHKTLYLEKNYRSLPGVMEFINDFFARSNLLADVEADFRGLQTEREPRDEAGVEFLVPNEDEEASRGDYRQREADLIAGRIAEICDGKSTSVYDEPAEKWRSAQYGDIAILLRTGTHIHTYEEALRKLGIPYNVVDGSGFFKRQEIADVRNLLETVLNPWNEMALVGFLRSPIASLKDETLMELCMDEGLASAFQSTKSVADETENERLTRARKLVSELRVGVDLPLATFMRAVLEETGYEAILLAQRHGVQKASNLRKLVDLAHEFAHTGPAHLRAFTHYLENLTHKEVREGEAELFASGGGAVTLMTVHKAKGLEFPIVVLADASRVASGNSKQQPYLVDRDLGLVCKMTDEMGALRLPAIGEIIKEEEKQKEHEEEARILYVAMTRARDRLVIGGSPKAGKGSWFKTLDDLYGLSNRGEGEVVAGDGWTAVVKREAIANSPVQATARSHEQPPIDRLLEQAKPLPQSSLSSQTISISTLLDAMCDTEPPGDYQSSVASKDAIDPLKRGTLVHRLLELWDFGADREAPIERVLREARIPQRHLSQCEADLRAIAERFRGMALFSELGVDGLRREVPFAFMIGDVCVSGKIDAIIGDGGIVDYKTGRHDPAGQGRYEHQLNLYAAALEGITGSRPDRADLCYIDEGAAVSVEITDDSIRDSLALAKSVL